MGYEELYTREEKRGFICNHMLMSVAFFLQSHCGTGRGGAVVLSLLQWCDFTLCLHQHDPVDLLEESPAPTATEWVLEDAALVESSQSEELPPSEAPALRDSLVLYKTGIF